ncbi:hypothetical protein ACHAPT_005280 [Fusarium lateritium]
MVAFVPAIGLMLVGVMISKGVDVTYPLVAEQLKGYGWGWGWSREPQIPAHLKGKVSQIVAPRVQICDAYEALFALHPAYHSTPPLLYTLLSVPLPSDDAAAYARLDHTTAILRQLNAKTAPHYETKENTFRGTEIRNQAQVAIDTWNLIVSILLDERMKVEYDTIVVRPIIVEGKTVKEVLLDHEMCGKKWGNGESS